MLQQTQVSRVLPAYRRFLRRFPTLRALSRAPLGAVLRELVGPRVQPPRARPSSHRAEWLVAAAHHRGARCAPGIGAYTASAVACFAFDEVRVSPTRTSAACSAARSSAVSPRMREAVGLDERFGSKSEPARWHHALMDLGATICVAKPPRCEVCPIRAICDYDGVAVVPRRKQSPFGASDRRVRGAIVRRLALSTRGVKVETLRRGINDARVPRLVQALAREGLVEVSSGSVRLPAR